MAKQARVPVQTVFMESNTPYLRRGSSPFRQPAFPLMYRARLGRRFDITGKLSDEVARIERYFVAELEETPSLGPRRE
jgi:hypothetical protein